MNINKTYSRRKTTQTKVGDIYIGSDSPIRIQTMANTSTNDIEGSVAQAQRCIAAGAELVRFTTQGLREVESLKRIHDSPSPLKEGANRQSESPSFGGVGEVGCRVPLVADVHFQADVADAAAQVVEKVRINPGNYIDPARKFKHIDYTEEEYQAEIGRLRERFTRLLDICKAHHTALRLGVNHGSLSDRIMSRYGDTPAGMVESVMEFLRVAVSEQFMDIVISVKASNTRIMVDTVRLLVQQMNQEGMAFPLHLGVTEAGEGEDGRIKSAVGIGALLADGIGDTVRVSLSEAPENEIPVSAMQTARRFSWRAILSVIPTKIPIGDCFSCTPPQSADGCCGNTTPPISYWAIRILTPTGWSGWAKTYCRRHACVSTRRSISPAPGAGARCSTWKRPLPR